MQAFRVVQVTVLLLCYGEPARAQYSAGVQNFLPGCSFALSITFTIVFGSLGDAAAVLQSTCTLTVMYSAIVLQVILTVT